MIETMDAHSAPPIPPQRIIHLATPRAPKGRLSAWRARIQDRWLSPVALVPSWALAWALLAALPYGYVERADLRGQEAWFAKGLSHAERIVQFYSFIAPVPPFTTGREAEVRSWLLQDPLALALVDPDSGAVWIRQAGNLAPAPPGPERDRYLEWGALARASHYMVWVPFTYRQPELSRTSFGVATTPAIRWAVIKGWRPGSPEADAFLATAMAGNMPIRFGLLDTAVANRVEPGARGLHLRGWRSPCGSEDYQIHKVDPALPFRQAVHQKRVFGDAWMPVVSMPASTYAAHLRALRLKATMAWGSYLAGAVLSVGALLAYMGQQKRKTLESRRIAALTHSLKTPLAVLRMRCDSALNPRLGRERQESELLRLGDGVEQLVELIERELEVLRPGRALQPRDKLTGAWFRDFQEDLGPLFQQGGRTLEIRVEVEAFLAHRSSLQSALSILLENALIHGRGRARLEVCGAPGAIRITVADEGAGIPPENLERTLTEGTHSQARVPGAPLVSGQGLGLFLLASMVFREGWGLRVEYGEAGGFAFVLEVPQ